MVIEGWEVDAALTDRLLGRRDLSRIHAFEPNVAVTSGFSRFLIHGPRQELNQVNTSMNMIMDVLHNLDPKIRGELFRDQLSFASYNTLMSTVPKRHPGALGLVLRVLGFTGSIHWILAFLGFALFEWKRRRWLKRSHCTAYTTQSARDRFRARLAFYTYSRGAE